MRACIFGASGGVGEALVQRLVNSGAFSRIFACSRNPQSEREIGCVLPLRFDLTDEASIRQVAERTAADGPLDLVIVATGMLHRAYGNGAAGTEEGKIAPEKSWRTLDPAMMVSLFAINSIGPALIAKHMFAILATDRRAVFAVLSARVGSISDNRLGGWHSYRASKAALNMLVRNFAIEYGRRNPQGLVIALHPGTVDTELSKPFQRNIPDDTLLSPDQSAERLLQVIGDLGPQQSGGFFAWDGQPIAF